jgi:hypothetical protein
MLNNCSYFAIYTKESEKYLHHVKELRLRCACTCNLSKICIHSISHMLLSVFIPICRRYFSIHLNNKTKHICPVQFCRATKWHSQILFRPISDPEMLITIITKKKNSELFKWSGLLKILILEPGMIANFQIIKTNHRVEVCCSAIKDKSVL